MKPPSTEQVSHRALLMWIVFNLILLGCYLAFFHLCLVFEFPTSLLFGVAIAMITVGVLVQWRRLFVNRYEFLIYLVLPLDILLEGLIPYHEGYSFYFCAAAFWAVFIFYRIYLARRNPENCQRASGEKKFRYVGRI